MEDETGVVIFQLGEQSGIELYFRGLLKLDLRVGSKRLVMLGQRAGGRMRANGVSFFNEASARRGKVLNH